VTTTPELRRQLLQMLRPGHERFLSRQSLAAELGVSDRTLRGLVEVLRRDGYLIGSTSEAPGGYFTIHSIAELEATATHMTSRAKACLATVGAMRRAAVSQFGDGTGRLFDLDEAV